MATRASAGKSSPDRAVLFLVSGGRSGALDLGLDWDAVDRICRSLGLGPALWCGGGLEQDAVPDGFRAACQAQAQVNAVLQALRQSALRQFHDAMTAAGAPFVLLKGMALALFVYDTPQRRLMSDIDILVREAGLDRAAGALQSIGFTPLPRNATGWISASGKVQVELHDSIMYPLDRATDARMWSAIVERAWNGRTWHMLNPSDCLQHVACHLARQHNCVAQLAHLLDVDALVRRFPGDIDYGRLLSAAGIGAGDARYVRLVLSLARRVLGTPVPDDVLPLPEDPSEPETLALALLLHARQTPLVTRTNALLASRSGADALARARTLIAGLFEPPAAHQGQARPSVVGGLVRRARHHRSQYSLKDLRPGELLDTRAALIARERLIELLDAD